LRLLGFDTSTDACIAGLVWDDQVSAERVVEPRAHTQLLMPMLTRLLEARGASFGDLDCLILGNGPGSFIGMRIAASVAQGIAFGAGLGLVPVSSLSVLAAEVFADSDCERCVVAQDARMSEVYLARYRRDSAGLPEAESETVLWPVGEPLDLDAGTGIAGEGFLRHPSLLGARRAPAVTLPDARYLLSVGARDFLAGRAVPPALLEPEYVRQTVATAASTRVSGTNARRGSPGQKPPTVS